MEKGKGKDEFCISLEIITFICVPVGIVLYFAVGDFIFSLEKVSLDANTSIFSFDNIICI